MMNSLREEYVDSIYVIEDPTFQEKILNVFEEIGLMMEITIEHVQ